MTSPDATSKPAFLGSGKQPKWADDKGTVPSLLLPNGERAEVIASIVLAYDATLGDYVVVPADHATGALTVTGGGGGGGGAVTVADGADVAQGTTTDAAVVTDVAGTTIGFLRGLVKLIAARMPVLGQSTKSGSVPVTVASDQGNMGVTVSNAFGLDATLTGGTQRGSFKLLDTGGTNVLSVSAAGAAKVDPSAVTSPVSIATAPALVAGTAEIGRVGLSKTGTGYAPYFMDAVSTTVKTVSGAAGKFAGIIGCINVNAGPAYLQIFDLATSGAVTLGTTVPTYVIAIPANATAANGVAIVATLDVGIAHANGIQIAATTTAKGSSALSTGLTGTIYYA